MSDVSNSDQDDIVAEYENRDSEQNQDEADKDKRTSDNEKNQEDDDLAKATKQRKPRMTVTLTTELLKGPKGIHTIEKYFEGFKFQGKGREKEDLTSVMKRLEHWAHRLYPKYDFDDCIKRIETLGNKKDLSVFVKKYRMDMLSNDDDDVVQNYEDNVEPEKEADPFDDLVLDDEAFESVFAVPEAPRPAPVISEEVSARIERNRQLALEKKRASMARAALLQEQQLHADSQDPETPVETVPEEDTAMKEKIERNRQLALERKTARMKEREEQERLQSSQQQSNEAVDSQETRDEVPVVITESTRKKVVDFEAMEILQDDY